MTPQEQSWVKAREILKEETCVCGSIPVLFYEAGVTVIQCERCGMQACAPDGETENALKAWVEKTK